MRDREQFEATAAALRSERQLSPDLQRLARWISDTFNTDVVNLVVDVLHDGRPRVMVWLRTADQAAAFRDSAGNYDRAKQAAISERYAQKFSTTKPFVAFTSFEPEARNRLIGLPPAELQALRNRLANPALWRIMAGWGRVIFFVHTDAEAVALHNGAEFDRWCSEFFDLITRRDEFDLLSRLPPTFELDSRERYERDFAGSSYNYFR